MTLWIPGPLTTALPCTVHRNHSPRSHINHRHHIWPLGEGGPDVKANIVVVCATGHSNIHALLDVYRATGATPGYRVRRRFSAGERRLAAAGWDAMIRGSIDAAG